MKFADPIVIGIDILELLSSAMYIDPLTIYREFVQNAADAIDEATKQGLYSDKLRPRVDLTLDTNNRTAKIRDNGIGIQQKWFARRLTALGGSKKRGTSARGFRGVGRLAGLGYCQQMTFRTKTVDDANVSVMQWDCRRLKELLRAETSNSDLQAVLDEIVTIEFCSAKDFPPHFFEVELRQLIRHKNDVLLNDQAVRHYIAQVGPVPFAKDFECAGPIRQFLDRFGVGKGYPVFLAGTADPITRPFTTRFEGKKGVTNTTAQLETIEIKGYQSGVDAVGWIMHHDYLGALPEHLGTKGLRVRVGDIQVGDANTLNSIFPEPRFGAWTIGEVHILTNRIVPNGRRDDFEQNAFYSNLINQLAPLGKKVAKKCRESSAQRAAKRATQTADFPENVSWPKLRHFVAEKAAVKLAASHKKAIKALLAGRGGTYGKLLSLLLDSSTGKKLA